MEQIKDGMAQIVSVELGSSLSTECAKPVISTPSTARLLQIAFATSDFMETEPNAIGVTQLVEDA